MIKNYIKIAWRKLWKNKVYSLINILGLALGISVTLIIALWVNSELKYDRFYTITDRLYQVYTRDAFDGEQHTWGGTPAVLGPILKEEHPEIEHMARVWNIDHRIHTDATSGFKATGIASDAAFFNLFDFQFINGNKLTPIDRPDAIVLTASMAKKLFGSLDVIGRHLELDTITSLIVEAVIQDIPHNSKFEGVDFFCSWNYLSKTGQTFSDSWTAYNHQTYVSLKEGIDLTTFNNKVEKLVTNHTNGETKASIYLYPASRWHLYNKSVNGHMVEGNMVTLRMFSLIGLFILLIACINFINLSTAGAERSAKEVGVRKVVGASKKSLIQQFLLESIIITLFAGIVALSLIVLALPIFNSIIQGNISINDQSLFFWGLFILFLIVSAIGAGIYPAFVLSSFEPTKTLKGNVSASRSGLKPRQILVILQFVISICLGICTFIISQQIRYGQDRKSGYDQSNLVYFPLEGRLDNNYEALRNELIQQDIASSVTKSWGRISRYGSNSWGYAWPNSKPEDYDVVFNNMNVDRDFIKTMGIRLLRGRDIDINKHPSDSTAVLLNEAAVNRMGLSDPIGVQIIAAKGTPYEKTLNVVGIIQDFVWQSPYDDIAPMLIQGPNWSDYVHIRLNPSRSLASNIANVELILKKYNPDFPTDLHFVDQEYAKKFASQKRTANLTGLFSGLAIFIACLGLFGLVSFSTTQRQKEVGIRKVLGASVAGIVSMLSKDFLKLVILAILIASPIAWWLMNKWLDSFVHRVDISLGTFIMAGALAVALALITISTLAIRAALSNPVKTLRDE
ncbi:duplicated orphan permease [Sphingobacterium nematocida]|uniref:Duplicated orphan permease n=1 Tax=Sphingobacterium nematocida TaxID=1513896 RepID=A0A1T5BH92_9SPHI|nr:ABC transporter permease [Sphingobacterium nematocida]SKB46672.1 duplicated orphan permease [Sphingobacterium nematocida]